jgi:hypothetical protein
MALDEKIYPWLLNTWIRNFFPKESEGKGFFYHCRSLLSMERCISTLRNIIVVTMAWYATPVTIAVFWACYLVRHDGLGSWIHIILFMLSLVAATCLHQLAKHTLRSKKLSLLKAGIVSGVIVLPFLLFTSSLTFKAIHGKPETATLEIRWLPWEIKSNVLFELKVDDKIKRGLSPWLKADISGMEVSERPDNYDPADPKQIRWVRGVRLNDANLNYANASEVFLTKAQLERASLVGINLYQSDLRYAQLQGADLRGADFRFADLSHADLSNANLSYADLREANLVMANFSGAKLTGADLTNADISNTLFYDVQDLTVDQIQLSIHWREGHFERNLQKDLGILYPGSN